MATKSNAMNGKAQSLSVIPASKWNTARIPSFLERDGLRLLGVRLLLIFSLLFPNTVFATHSVGFDLRYECMGGNLYRFTLNFYRDCEGLEAPISPTIYLS